MQDRFEISIVLDESDIKRGFKKVGVEAEKSGKKAGDRFNKGFSTGIGPLAVTAAAVGASLVAAFSTKRFVEAAAIQEDAVNSFNSALIATGKFTEQASQDFQDFASQIQANSRFGDEIILQNAALIQSLGDLDEKGLKRATQAAVDLAAGLKIDLRSAATLVGKAAAGEVSSFTRYGLAIKKAGSNSETFANALRAIEGRLSGSASRDVQTFSGGFEQLSNLVGDAEEALGKFITQSPALAKVFNIGSSLVAKFTARLNSLAQERDLLSPLISGVLSLGEAINVVVLPSIRIITRGFGLFVNAAATGINTVISGIASLGGAAAKALSFFGVRNDITELLSDFDRISAEVRDGSIKDLKESFDSLFSIDTVAPSQKVANIIEDIRNQISVAKEEGVGLNSLVSGQGGAGGLESLEENESQKTAIVLSAETQRDAIRKTAATREQSFNKTFSDGLKQLAQQAKSIVSGGIGRAFEAFGQALRNGESASKAFSDVFRSMIADLASAAGDFFILEGLSRVLRSYGTDATGYGLIAAGGGLKLLAGLLGGSSSSNAVQTNQVGTGGGVAASGGDGLTASSGTEPLTGFSDSSANSGPSINLNIQGDVFDSDQTGTRIARILSEAFQDEDIQINQGAFA